MTGCLSLATDPESSVQIKLASCVFDLIIAPAVAWAKNKSKNADNVERELGWQLCCKISDTGKQKNISTKKISSKRGRLQDQI